MTTSAIRVAIDAGQSGTRSVAVDAAGRTLRRGRAAGVGRIAARGEAGRTADTVAAAYREVVGEEDRVEVLAVGLSGWSSDRTLDQRLLASVARRTAARRTVVTSDGVTAFIGASGARPGVVVAAGTGVIAIAADGRGAWASGDGLGHALGDRGGGFWIGREGLWLALARAGRAGTSALVERASARFGPLDSVGDTFHRHEDRVGWIAGFATDLADLATAGDGVVRQLWADAGELLGATACDTADRIFPTGAPVSIVLTGGLAGAAELLSPAMAARIERRRPGSTVRTTRDGPSRGTLRLARDERLAEWFPGGILERRAR